jgi:hypothetical protein
MGVYMGGKANRMIYLWAADPVALMQARQSYLPELMSHPKFPEVAKICGAATITLHNLITISSGSPSTAASK